MTLDHYEVLGIDRLASMTDVRRAFRQRALENHPDKNPRGETLFKQVAAAYQVLSDENRRTEYNNVLGNLGTRPPSAPAAAAGRSFCAAGQQHQQRYTRPSTARCSQSYSYTVHQQDISNMMRRDADAARKADRNSREFSRWRTQYAAHQNASEMAKAAAAGPSPRPSSASFKEQRQHVLQQQVQTLWQMHQRRWSKAGVKNNTFREENTQNSIDQPKQQAEEELREEALRTARQQQQQDDEKRLREEHVMELLRKEQMDFADKIKNNSTNSTNTTNTTNTMDDTNSCSNCSRSSSPISTSSFSSNSAVSLSFESTTKIKSPAAETVRKSTPASSPSPPPPPLPTHSFTADATVISSSVSVIDTLPTDTEIQSLPEQELEMLEAAFQKKIRLVQQVRLLHSLGLHTVGGGVAL